MSTDLGQFANVARGLANNATVHVQPLTGEVSARQDNNLHLSRLAANRASVGAFLLSIQKHPAFERAGTADANLLRDKLHAGSPLQAGDVKRILGHLDAAHAAQVGKDLVRAGVLPASMASAFTQFAIKRGEPLDLQNGMRVAVRAFLLEHAIPKATDKLLALPATDVPADKATLFREMLIKDSGATDGVAHLQRLVLDSIGRGIALGNQNPLGAVGLTSLAEIGIEKLFATANQEKIALLRSLRPSDLNTLQNAAPGTLDRLVGIKEQLGNEAVQDFMLHTHLHPVSLESPADVDQVIQEFMLDRAGKNLAATPLPPGVLGTVPNELRAGMAKALAYNPDVLREAGLLLSKAAAQNPPGTQAQADAALREARDAFAARNEAQLGRLATLADAPPAGVQVRPALTRETLPMYLNTLLVGDTLLEPLLGDEAAIDQTFLNKVRDCSQAVLHIGTLVHGVADAHDMLSLRDNAFKLLIAQRGIDAPRMADLVQRGVARFGTLARQLNTLQKQGDMQIKNHAEATCKRMSEIIRSAFTGALNLADPEQLSRAGIDTARLDALMQSNFMDNAAPTELSPTMVAFGRALGLHLPDAQSEASRAMENAALTQANLGIVGRMVDDIFPSASTIRMPKSASFRELASEVIRDLQLEHVHLDAIEPTFSSAIRNAAQNLAVELATHDRTPDDALLREFFRAALGNELQRLENTLADIEALPAPEGGSPDLRPLMAEMAHTYSLRDVSVLAKMAEQAGTCTQAVQRLASPGLPPDSLAWSVKSVGDAYTRQMDSMEAQGQSVPVDALDCFLSMTLRRAGRSEQADGLNMLDNLKSAHASKVAAGFLYISGEEQSRSPAERDKTSREREISAATAHAVMTEFLTVAEETAGHFDVGRAPLFFSEAADHLAELPAQFLLSVFPNSPQMQLALNNLAPRFDADQWDALIEISKPFMDKCADKEMVSNLLVNAGEDLLAAAGENMRPLGEDEVAHLVLGAPLTRAERRNGASPGDRLCNALFARMTPLAQVWNPEASSYDVSRGVTTPLKLGVSARTLFALGGQGNGKEGMRLEKPQIGAALEMKETTRYNASTTYGLPADFHRLGDQISVVFKGGQGDDLTVSPKDAAQNHKADSPLFAQMLNKVTSMTQSEAQKVRVFQALSQAGCMTMTMLCCAFPGASLLMGGIPPLNRSVTAQRDGSIVVEMTSPKNSPLQMEQTYLIKPDGTHECTHFLLQRGAVS